MAAPEAKWLGPDAQTALGSPSAMPMQVSAASSGLFGTRRTRETEQSGRVPEDPPPVSWQLLAALWSMCHQGGSAAPKFL